MSSKVVYSKWKKKSAGRVVDLTSLRKINKKVKKSSSTKKNLLFIDDEDFERVFEIRIRDLRERKGVKQKSFSISVRKNTRDDEYFTAEELMKEIQEIIKKKRGVENGN